jgi:hypothetical protein
MNVICNSQFVLFLLFMFNNHIYLYIKYQSFLRRISSAYRPAQGQREFVIAVHFVHTCTARTGLFSVYVQTSVKTLQCTYSQGQS